MFAFVLAAALLIDPTPKKDVAVKAPHATVERTLDAGSGPTLTAVAVTLECTARATGRVTGCRVLGETHPGLGFGEAAIALMRGAEVEPGPRDVQFARTIQFMP
ncbi:TonB family protein [Brevundimonas sp.]|jgi:TonB family protein|uniref:TonB family protein n=1 Tax=Brevundimonas sp. TaxID=1871086 RepID=UPI003782DDF7